MPFLAIVAVSDGLLALRSGSTAWLRSEALLGVMLGIVEIIAVIVVVLRLSIWIKGIEGTGIPLGAPSV